jgi:tRNA threonylcarbamoyladenosine modification (KEOPS) complex  Pcc1 subunit
MLTAQILVPVNDDLLEKVFSGEEKDFPSERASYSLKRTPNGLEFNIKANDSVALRSVLNTITKIITVHEKTGALL